MRSQKRIPGQARANPDARSTHPLRFQPVHRLLPALTAALVLAVCGSASAGTTLAPLAPTFDQPTSVTSPPGDTSRLFVTEQPGKIVMLKDGTASTFVDLSDATGDHSVRCCGERGLFSMAFDPNYATSGLFYVYYTRYSDAAITIEEFKTTDPDDASHATRRLVLTIPHDEASNHNGGQLQFGPDGFLYLGTGDGGGGDGEFGHSRDKNSLLAKLLRIDPRGAADNDHTSPASNPYVGKDGADEIYAFGLRNPYRFSFDRLTGDLILADVGQNDDEEVDWLAKGTGLGRDFGWNCFEGFAATTFPERDRTCPDTPAALPGYVTPAIDIAHPAFSAIIGGYVVRDKGLGSLYGHYIYGDDGSGALRYATLSPVARRKDCSLPGLTVSFLGSFGEDAAGHLYATSLSDGKVYRFTGASTLTCIQPPPAGGSGGGGGGNPPQDRRAPALKVRGTIALQDLQGVGLWATCDEACALTLRATAHIPRKHQHSRPVLSHTLKRQLGSDQRIFVRAAFGPHGLTSLKRALRHQRKLAVTVSVAVKDAAGNARRVTRHVHIHR